jgi:hypothetical protein
MFLNQKVEGERVEIQIPLKPPFVVYVHPDGAMTFLETETRSRLDDVTLAEKRLAKVNRKLTAGSIDDDEYEEAKAEADKDKAKALELIKKSFESGELTQSQRDTQLKQIESAYKSRCSDLLNQRDGTPPSPQEAIQLTEDKRLWEAQANFKPFAVPYLKNVLTSWEYWKDEEAKAHAEPCLEVSEALLDAMSDTSIKLITIAVMNHYQKKVVAEGKSLPTGSGSMTQNGMADVSHNGDLSTKSQENGNLTPIELPDGEVENFAVAL